MDGLENIGKTAGSDANKRYYDTLTATQNQSNGKTQEIKVDVERMVNKNKILFKELNKKLIASEDGYLFDKNIIEFQRQMLAEKEKITIFDSTTFMVPYVQTIFESSPDLKITIVGRLQINDELLIQPGTKGL